MNGYTVGICLEMFFNSLESDYQEQVKIRYDNELKKFTIFTPKVSKDFNPDLGKEIMIKDLTQLAIDINYYGV
jgi:hypothetical protein